MTIDYSLIAINHCNWQFEILIFDSSLKRLDKRGQKLDYLQRVKDWLHESSDHRWWGEEHGYSALDDSPSGSQMITACLIRFLDGI